MNSTPRVSVVIVSYNTRPELLRCLRALHQPTALSLEIIVVDNASADGSADAVRNAFPDVHVEVNDVNVGFSRANNQGWRRARAPYVLLLNSDAELQASALETLVTVLDKDAQADIAAVGPKTRNSDGTPQVSFGPALSLAAEWRQRRLVEGVRRRNSRALALAEQLTRCRCEPDWLSAACLLIRTQALRALGGFDEGFFLYEEDVDLCVRLRATGWRLLYVPEAVVVHELGRSMAQAGGRARLEYQRSHVRYYRKHRGGFETFALRALLAGAAAWNLCLGRGPEVHGLGRRRLQAALLRIALTGR